MPELRENRFSEIADLRYAPRVGNAIYRAAWLTAPGKVLSPVVQGQTETQLIDALCEKLGFCSEVIFGFLGDADGKEFVRTVDILFGMQTSARRSLVAAVLRGDHEHGLPSMRQATGGQVFMSEDVYGVHLNMDKRHEVPAPGIEDTVVIARGATAEAIPQLNYPPRQRRRDIIGRAATALPIVQGGHVTSALIESVRASEEAAYRNSIAGNEFHVPVYGESTADRVAQQQSDKE